MAVQPIAWAIMDMANHARANPTHGHNCACKDQFIRNVRRTITQEEVDQLTHLSHCLNSGHYEYPRRADGQSKVSGT
jgi:hypothetical protein